LETCELFQPEVIVTTGAAPVSAPALQSCREKGIKCINFSTDDPFNPRQRAPWFLQALREYDVVFTPRTVNREELRLHGCRRVEYLPFGYDESLFFPEPSVAPEEESDLFFAGTGDRDRLPYVRAAIDAGFCMRLHGIYWDRFPETKSITRGQDDIPTLRRAIAVCRIALCLVRHANRDGYAMRTFEVPAFGSCMMVEGSLEYWEIFGQLRCCAVRKGADRGRKAEPASHSGAGKCSARFRQKSQDGSLRRFGRSGLGPLLGSSSRCRLAAAGCSLWNVADVRNQ